MKSAFGLLHLTPETFWSMTMVEFRATSLGYAQANSATRSSVNPLSRSELEDMMERFPDDR